MRLWRENSLSIVSFGFFIVFLAAQSVTGHRVEIENLEEHGGQPIGYLEYISGGGFAEATFENWESEFLQMGAYVFLTVFLRQKGSAESKKLSGREEVDADPRASRTDPRAPWPVRRGGVVLVVYENSLALAFLILFLASFALHAAGGGRGLQPGATTARRSHGDDVRVPGDLALLVRVFPELAERVPSGGLDRRALDLPAAARLARIEAGGGAARRNRLGISASNPFEHGAGRGEGGNP